MKISKIASIVAAAAMAVSAAAISASATNWANAGYADNNPDTVQIISTDENSVTFTITQAGVDGSLGAKARVVAGDLLDDPTLVKSATWTVTYNIPADADASNGVGGGCYFGCKNSTDYWINPDYADDGSASWSTGTYTATCEAKFLLPTESLTADSELVFMDWSNNPALLQSTIAISDLKFFDADGNEIAQKPYAGAAAAEAAPAETTTEAAPAADNTTTAASTGNAAVASIAAVMAAAGVAAIAAKKRK